MLSINLFYADKRQPQQDDIAPTVTVRLQRSVKEQSLLSKPIKPCNVVPENMDMRYAKVKMYSKHF